MAISIVGVVPCGYWKADVGVKLLGGAVSRDKGFIEGLATKRASRDAELMHLLPQLRDPHSELLLLRLCIGIAKLFFGLKRCQPIHMEMAAMLFDKKLRGAVEDIVVGGGPFFGGPLMEVGFFTYYVCRVRFVNCTQQ